MIEDCWHILHPELLSCIAEKEIRFPDPCIAYNHNVESLQIPTLVIVHLYSFIDSFSNTHLISWLIVKADVNCRIFDKGDCGARDLAFKVGLSTDSLKLKLDLIRVSTAA